MWDDHEVRDNWYWERRRTATRATQVKSRGAARGARAAGVLRVQPAAARSADDPERVYRVDPVSDRSSRSSRSTCAATRARTARTASRRWTEASAIFGRGAAALAEGRARGQHGDVEDRRRGSAARPRRPRRRRTLRGGRERRCRARRSGASWRSRTCSAHPRQPGPQRRLDHRRTCTTAPRITTIRRARGSPSSIRSGSSSPARCNAGTFRPEHARRDLRPGGPVRRGHSAGDEAQSPAERGLPVLRDLTG